MGALRNGDIRLFVCRLDGAANATKGAVDSYGVVEDMTLSTGKTT